MKTKISRREFLQQAGIATAGIVVGSTLLNNRSYGRILGANDRVRLAFAGVNSRGSSLIGSFAKAGDVDVLYVCDPERKALEKGMKAAVAQGFSPRDVVDFRTILDPKKIDALVVATPDHWHTPAAILAARSGVNVYLEKPVSHNAAEGEMLLQAWKKHQVAIGVGSQRRSVPYFQECIQRLHEGEIGNIYAAKGWYVNNRGKNNFTKNTPVPAGLDWDLWQGPAPRVDYEGGFVHYNWHWTWHWGTSEAGNNGPHEMDLMAWGTKASFPGKVMAMGGRYQYQDSWECPDTLHIRWECPGLMLGWDGHSRNGAKIENNGRGTWFYGTEGSMQLLDSQCNIFDPRGKQIKTIRSKENDSADVSTDTTSPGLSMDVLHVQNFLDAVRGKGKLTATPVEGHLAALYLHLGNISQRLGRSLTVDSNNGHILDDPQAQALFGRTYETGWEPKI